MASKEEERDLLQQASEFCPELRTGIIEDSERPDFVLNWQEQRIGLEVTRYFHKGARRNRTAREREEALKLLCEAALEHFSKLSQELVHITTHWAAHFHPRKKQIQTIAKRLARSVINCMPSMKNETYVLTSSDLQRFDLDRIVQSLSVMRLSAGFSDWSTLQSGSSVITPEELQKIIDDKNAKTAEYRARNKFAQLWLAIIADGKTVASYAAITANVCEHKYAAGFDRVFFISLGYRSSAELQRKDS